MLIAAIFLLVFAPAQGPQRETQMIGPSGLQGTAPSPAPLVGTGAISGVVTDSTTNRPISGAVVVLGPGAGRAGNGPTSQLTDDRGRFVFAGLAAFDGYTLDVRKGGYFAGHVGRSAAGTRIALADGQWVKDANILLRRFAVISGTVTDEHGAPVANAYIRLIREFPIAGVPHLASGPVTQTDDRGMYRLSGLDPGRYVVIAPNAQHAVPDSPATMQALSNLSAEEFARVRAEGRSLSIGAMLPADTAAHVAVSSYPVPTPTADGRILFYRTLYFPDATSLDSATRVELKYGDERRGVDFHLQPTTGVRVSGTVEGPAEATQGLTLRLIPAGMEDVASSGSEVASAPIGEGNRFIFVNVTPGSYVILGKRVNSEISFGGSYGLPAPPGRGNSFGMSTTLGGGVSGPNDPRFSLSGSPGSMAFAARMPVTVDSAALDGLVVPMQRGATIVAKIVKEGSVAGQSNLSIEPAQGSLVLSPGRNPGPPPADGVFTFEGLMPGEYFVRMTGVGVVKSIVSQGRDFLNEPFDLSNGKDITDIVVAVADQAASLTGAVRDRAGAPASEVVVTVFPAGRDQWVNYGLTPVRIKSAMTSTSGTYRIAGLPAGDYLAVAVA